MLPKRIEVEQILVFLNYISHCLIGKDYRVSLTAIMLNFIHEDGNVL